MPGSFDVNVGYERDKFDLTFDLSIIKRENYMKLSILSPKRIKEFSKINHSFSGAEFVCQLLACVFRVPSSASSVSDSTVTPLS